MPCDVTANRTSTSVDEAADCTVKWQDVATQTDTHFKDLVRFMYSVSTEHF